MDAIVDAEHNRRYQHTRPRNIRQNGTVIFVEGGFIIIVILLVVWSAGVIITDVQQETHTLETAMDHCKAQDDSMDFCEIRCHNDNSRKAVTDIIDILGIVVGEIPCDHDETTRGADNSETAGRNRQGHAVTRKSIWCGGRIVVVVVAGHDVASSLFLVCVNDEQRKKGLCNVDLELAMSRIQKTRLTQSVKSLDAFDPPETPFKHRNNVDGGSADFLSVRTLYHS